MSVLPAIVIPAYKRPKALRGLLSSVAKAEYPEGDIHLIISIDGGGDPAVEQVAQAFEWKYGSKQVVKHTNRLGLMAHIMQCADLTEGFDAVIILEEDLEVAKGFYKYAVDALTYYWMENQVAGISLYSYDIAETTLQPFQRLPNPDSETFFIQYPSSWGQAFTKQQWAGFKKWLAENPDPKVKLPAYVQSWSPGSWKKRYLEYLMHTDKYFVYPDQSLSSNMGYAGANFPMQMDLFQVDLDDDYQPQQFAPFNKGQHYNAWFEPMPDHTRLKTDQQAIPKIELALYEHSVQQGYTGSKAWFLFKFRLVNYVKVFFKKLGLD